MTQSKPRLGLDNLLYSNRRDLIANHAATGHDVENLGDWTPGRSWKDDHTSTPPADGLIYCYPLNQSGLIRLNNWYFSSWPAGSTSDPGGWTFGGASGSVGRTAYAPALKIHDATVAITRTTDDCYLEQEFPSWARYKSRKVTLGAWCWAAVASQVCIAIDDGTTVTPSSFHSGGSTAEWLTVTATIPYNATTIKARLSVEGFPGNGGFDGVVAYLGDTAESTPHDQSVDYLAAYGHNLDSCGRQLALQYTTDASKGPGSTWTTHLNLHPSNDRAAWVDGASQSAAAWRLTTWDAVGVDTEPAVLDVVSFGAMLELSDWINVGFNPLDHKLTSRTPTTKHGTPITRSVNTAPLELSITQDNVEESTITGEWQTFLEHASSKYGGRAIPFFFQWDDGDHEDQTFYCWLGDQASFKAPQYGGYKAKDLRVTKWLAIQ